LIATTLPLCFSAASHTVPKLPAPSCLRMVKSSDGEELGRVGHAGRALGEHG